MENQKKLEQLADMFEIEVSGLTPETKLEELDEWDSLAKLSLIVLMDDEYGKKLTGDEIKQFVTIGDIMNYMG